jgi:hypothetical protein
MARRHGHRPPAHDPVVAEQREIVRRVGLLFERADTIEREVAAGRPAV